MKRNMHDLITNKTSWLLTPDIYRDKEPNAWATGIDYQEHVYNFYEDGSCILVIPVDRAAADAYGDSHLSIYFEKLEWSPKLHSVRWVRTEPE